MCRCCVSTLWIHLHDTEQPHAIHEHNFVHVQCRFLWVCVCVCVCVCVFDIPLSFVYIWKWNHQPSPAMINTVTAVSGTRVITVYWFTGPQRLDDLYGYTWRWMFTPPCINQHVLHGCATQLMQLWYYLLFFHWFDEQNELRPFSVL